MLWSAQKARLAANSREVEEDYKEPMLRDFVSLFGGLSVGGKERWMAAVVDSMDNHMLGFVKGLVSPRLKKDPFAVLPNEICFKVCGFDGCVEWFLSVYARRFVSTAEQLFFVFTAFTAFTPNVYLPLFLPLFHHVLWTFWS